MKITAVGANRAVYRHTILDSKIESAQSEGEVVVFNLLSTVDPGIGSGQFVLSFEFGQAEVFSLYEQAITLKQNNKIEALESEIKDLKAHLQEVN